MNNDMSVASLDSIEKSITDIHKKLDQQNTLHGEWTACKEKNAADIHKLKRECYDLRSVNTQLRLEVTILRAIVSKQSSDIECLKRDVTDQQSRSMQNNVLFHQVPEEKKRKLQGQS